MDLGHRVANIQLRDNKDIGIWQLHKSGQFLVRSMYSVLLYVRVLPINKSVWKLKIPLKVKVFIWLLHILAKDNLAKRNWKGSKQCCFCMNDETIVHLFFGCHMARLFWRIIFITFGLTKPNNIVHLFGWWLQGFLWEKKKVMFTGLCALLWSIWLSRNNVVFHNTKKQMVLQILFKATYLTRIWAILQKEEDRVLIADACRALEVTTMDIFAWNGWQFSNRLYGL